MKKFLFQTSLFLTILIVALVCFALLPPTPRVSKSLVFAKVKKDLLLKNTQSPRIIFIGGSNLSFGLNSKSVKGSLGLNPINTAVHGSIGLFYMLDSTLPYILPGDIIVVVPEYQQFYGKLGYGENELLITIMNVAPTDLSKLSIAQLFNIAEYFPKFSLSKVMPREYFNVRENDIYGVGSFNQFGDADAHWSLSKREFDANGPISEPFNFSAIEALHEFERELLGRNAIMLVSFPGFQSSSFNNNIKQISRVEDALRHEGFMLLGTAQRYRMPDDLMFDTPYHLTKDGVDHRTRLLIEDIIEHLCSGQHIPQRTILDSGFDWSKC